MVSLTRAQLAAYAAIGVLVLVLGGQWLARRAGAAAPGSARGATTATAGMGDGARAGADGGGGVRVQAAARVALVHVAGLVRRPGVYRLAAGARVQDAVRRAGGATRHGDANAINLAAPVQDGSQIVVPARAPRAGAAAGQPADATATAGTGAEAPAPPVSLNSATAEQLETLDGIGPVTAAKIIAYRQENGGFRSIEDLAQVPGIGPKRLAALRDRVQL